MLIAGALVTSNDAGLSVPDWPLSYGSLLPPMVGGIFYEHGHRMIATLVGTLSIVLAVWLWRVESRRWVRWLGVAALGAVVAQGILGGITVLFFLPPPISAAHATLAQLFFCTVAEHRLIHQRLVGARTAACVADSGAAQRSFAGHRHGVRGPLAADAGRRLSPQSLRHHPAPDRRGGRHRPDLLAGGSAAAAFRGRSGAAQLRARACTP